MPYADPSDYRDWKLQDRYDLSLDDWYFLLEMQDYVCAICGELPTKERFKKLNVDHDHETGKVRGLLCTACNAGQGQLRDDPRLVRKALEYLESHDLQHSMGA